MAQRLGLKDLQCLVTSPYNSLYSGFLGTRPIVLKLGFDEASLQREAVALKNWSGYGAAEVIAVENGIILLERVVPGKTLQEIVSGPFQETLALKEWERVVKRLHQAPLPRKSDFPPLKEWLACLDGEWDIPRPFLVKARQYREELLQTAGQEVLLHGDLHHTNILQKGEGQEREWVVIDPKGVMGELAYEMGAFVRNPLSDVMSCENLTSLLVQRISYLSEGFALSPQRLLKWCFVQAVQSWVWALEDREKTEPFQKLSQTFYEIIA